MVAGHVDDRLATDLAPGTVRRDTWSRLPQPTTKTRASSIANENPTLPQRGHHDNPRPHRPALPATPRQGEAAAEPQPDPSARRGSPDPAENRRP